MRARDAAQDAHLHCDSWRDIPFGCVRILCRAANYSAAATCKYSAVFLFDVWILHCRLRGAIFFNAQEFQEGTIIQRPTVLTFSDDGISIESGDGKAHVDWDVIKEITESERDFLIGVSKSSFWTIPKRTIPDEA